MPTASPLQPTLWRTCRVLANRTRLHLFRLLARQPNQTVTDVATCLKLPLAVASQYLRALEARGLLSVRRVGLHVTYRLAGGSSTPAQPLVRSLRLVFRRQSMSVEMLFKTFTAFTHPRRIEIFRALGERSRCLRELNAVTRISTRALSRHVKKLEARGFIVCRDGQYAVVNRSDAVGRELSRLANG